MRKLLSILFIFPLIVLAQTNNYNTLDKTSANITGGTISGVSPPIPVASGGTGTATSTGTAGSVVLSNSPVLVTPNIGAATASSLAVTGNVNVQGNISSASNTSPAGVTNSGVSLNATPSIADIQMYDATQTVGNRTSEWIFWSGSTSLRLANDAHSAVVVPFSVAGGQGSGITGITTNSGSGPWAHTGALSATGTISAPTINATSALQSNGTTILPNLSGASGSIGGGALLAGACAVGTATVTGATTSMIALTDPVTYPGDGNTWEAYVSSSNTVTVKVCAIVAGTPIATTYNVRIIQ